MPRPKTIHGIDPYAPGGIEELLNFHRGHWGNMQMNANAGGESGGESGANEGSDEGSSTASSTASSTGEGEHGQQAQQATGKTDDKSGDWDGKVESLPPAVQKMIADLRKADGDERVAKKQLDAIAKALNPDAKGDDKPTAEQLTKQLADRDATAKQAQTELAIYKLAGKTGADADALLDSRAFLAKIAELDHTDTAKVTKAITDAITENPKLKIARAATTSRADTSGGSGEGALTKAQFDAMSIADRNKLYNTNLPLYRQLTGN